MTFTSETDLSGEDVDSLVEAAVDARSQAYNPYSGFAVGSAVLTAAGDVYDGCNVENINFTNTVHAEQAAISAAVSDGERDFRALAVATPEPIPPCGLCRQTLAEFADEDFPVLTVDASAVKPGETIEDAVTVYRLGYLLPEMMESIN